MKYFVLAITDQLDRFSPNRLIILETYEKNEADSCTLQTLGNVFRAALEKLKYLKIVLKISGKFCISLNSIRGIKVIKINYYEMCLM